MDKPRILARDLAFQIASLPDPNTTQGRLHRVVFYHKITPEHSRYCQIANVRTEQFAELVFEKVPMTNGNGATIFEWALAD